MGFIAAASVALTAIGTAVSAYGQYESMSQQEDMLNYNAEVAEAEAEQKRMETRERVNRTRKENDRFKSKQRAAFAKSGITSTGTPLELMSQTAADLELRALDTAYAGESQRQALLQNASVNKINADATGRAAPIAAASTILGGANQLARLKL